MKIEASAERPVFSLPGRLRHLYSSTTHTEPKGALPQWAPPHLKVLEPVKTSWRLPGSLRRVFIFSIVAIALISAVVARAEMAKWQVSLQTVQEGIASAEGTRNDLILQSASLSSPQRILSIAEGKLGMKLPSTVQLYSSRTGSILGSVTQIEPPGQTVPLPAGSQVAPPSNTGSSVPKRSS